VTGRPPDQDGPPELLKTSEVARLLGVTRSTVLSWAYRGLLDHATTPGGQLRFHRDQIETLLATGHDRTEPDRAAAPQGEAMPMTDRHHTRSAKGPVRDELG
jgi:excisionase family DNA binding protein